MNSVLAPLHKQLSFTLEGYAYDEGFNAYGDLPQRCSPSDPILARDPSAERGFINPP
jgi:hypothetical protein